MIEATLPVTKPGPYQLQAAIAAVHDEAADLDATDWPQILALYDVLATLAPGPMIALNRTVAVAMVRGPAAALAELDDAAADPALRGHHRVDAVRAHLLDELGDQTPPGSTTSRRPSAPAACPRSATCWRAPHVDPCRAESWLEPAHHVGPWTRVVADRTAGSHEKRASVLLSLTRAATVVGCCQDDYRMKEPAMFFPTSFAAGW